jgi:hypothetical protein
MTMPISRDADALGSLCSSSDIAPLWLMPGGVSFLPVAGSPRAPFRRDIVAGSGREFGFDADVFFDRRDAINRVVDFFAVGRDVAEFFHEGVEVEADRSDIVMELRLARLIYMQKI